MTKTEQNQAQQVNIQSDLFADDLQIKMPGAEVLKSGGYTFITLANSTWCLYAIADGVYDLAGEFADGRKMELEDISSDDVQHFILDLYRQENPTNEPRSPGWDIGVNEDAESNPPQNAPATGSASPNTPAMGAASPRPTTEAIRRMVAEIVADYFVEDDQQAAEDAANNPPQSAPTSGSVAKPTNEQSTTGGVSGYNPAKAWTAPGQKLHRGIMQSQKEGWTLMSETTEHLKGLLPVEAENVVLDDAGNITITADDLRLRIVPKGGSFFDIETFIGEKREPKQVQLSYSKMLQYVFDAVGLEQATGRVVSGIGKKETGEEAEPADNGEEVTASEAFSVLKELARESGAYGGDDILRNRNLTDLRGLVQPKAVTPKPFVTLREQLAERFDRRPPVANKAPVRQKSAPPGRRGDAPVSLNENRDVNRPYASTMGGKVLVMDPERGAVLVDKAQIKPGMKLSWDPKAGAVMVPDTEETKRPSWRPYWQQDR